ncbi:MAG: M23 family metallopeptidase [Acidimicrobiia bacterium]
MPGRQAAAGVAAAILVTALYAMSISSSPATAAEMCPPVTMDVLFPPITIPAVTTTTAPVVTTSTTTTAPTTTTTTEAPPETTTTVPATTSSTTPLETTSTTQAPPETTTTTIPPPPCDPFVYDLTWPLAAPGQIGSPFGADRDGGARKHQGVDIAAPKLTPVLAVANGVVSTVAQEVGTEDCCWTAIRHTDGWQAYYIHLNNDRHGTDDGLGIGVRTDLAVGTPVKAGDVIGWVGDSGNAEDTVEHLHFELRDPEGIPIDPRPSLDSARGAAVLLDPQPGWPYADYDGDPGEAMAAMMLSEGILLDCDGSRINFCPDKVASPDLAFAIARHLLGKEPPRIEGRYQPLTEKSAPGCERVDACVLLGLPETEIARLAMWVRTDALVASLRSSPPVEGVPVILLLSAEEAESLIRTIGAREACNPPLDDQRLLTRAETLIRLVSWARGTNPEPCLPPAQPTL